MNDTATEKKRLRQEMKKRRSSLGAASRLEKEGRIRENLCRLPEFSEAEYVFSYVSYRSEVDTRVLLEYCLEKGKQVFVPKVLDKEKMAFYAIRSLSQLEKGPMGIWEPKAACPPYRSEDCPGQKIMLLPGLAFDKKGGRLGYGGGYYDRYLADFGPCLTVALAYGCQIIPSVPCGQTDIKTNVILTENAIIRTGG